MISRGRSKAFNDAPSNFQCWVFFIGLTLCVFGASEQIFGYTIRLERVVAVIWILCIPFRNFQFNFKKESLLLAGWILLALFSSFLSIEPGISVRGWLDLSLAAAFFYICQINSIRFLILKPMGGLMLLGTILGAGAVVSALIHGFGHDPIGSIWANFIMDEGDTFRIRMTLLEPNLYGAAMAIFSLLSIAEFSRRDRLTLIPLLFSHIGLILSFSRGPFIGYCCGLFLYVVLIKPRINYLKWVLILSVATIPFFLLFFDDAGSFDKYLNRGYTIEARLIGVNLALLDIPEAPLVGNGIYSFSYLHPELSAMLGAGAEEKSWIGNQLLLVLHDTGIIGFTLLYSFFALTILGGCKAVKFLRSNCNHKYLQRSSAWLGAAVSILVASIATPSYSLGLFWCVFAVCYRIPKIVINLKNTVKLNA